jgi:ABC-type cobalt transport system substrate-binding protein
LRRNAVDVLVTVIAGIATLIAFSSIPDAEFYVASARDQARNLARYEPEWGPWMNAAIVLWTASEVVVMLFNRQRRSLHDFIAGTVVVADAAAREPNTPVMNEEVAHGS